MKRTFVGFNKDYPSNKTKGYTSVRNVIFYGMRKPDMLPGAFSVVEVHEDGSETYVMDAYKQVSLTKR